MIAEARFLSGNLMRHVTTMALSSSVGLLSVFLVDFADLYFISLLGQAELAAAVGFAGTVSFFVFSITIGLAIAIGALVARRLGAGRDAEARTVATSVLLVGVAFSALIAVLTTWQADALVTLLGASGETRRLATGYLHIVLPAIPLGALGIMCSSLLRAHGDARRAMQVTLWAGGVNAVLDPLLIFGVGLGLDGAALATVCARAVMAGAALHAVHRHHAGLARPSLEGVTRHLAPMLGIAGPAVLTNVATPVGNAMVMRFIAGHGDAAVAAYAVIGRLIPLVFCTIYAVSGAVGPIVGQNAGAERYDRVRETLVRALRFVALAVLLAWVFLLLARPLIVTGFGLDAQGASIVFWFVVLAAPLFFFNGALFVANGAFNNLRRPLWATWLNWGRNTLGVLPFVWAGSALGGAAGVLVGQALGGLVFGVLGTWLSYRLVAGYARGELDTDGHRLPALERARPDAPFSSPRG